MTIALLYTIVGLVTVVWMGQKSRNLSDQARFAVGFYLFLFGGMGVFFALEESDRTLLLTSCVNQLFTLAYLLAAGVGATPKNLPNATHLWKWVGGSLLIGGAALIISGLLLEWFESVGGEVQTQGLVDLLAQGEPLEQWLTVVLVVGLAPVCEELLFRGTLLPWAVDKVGEWSGIIATGTLFGLMHFETVTAVPPLIVFGIVLSWWARHTGWVLFPIIAHFCNNGLVVLSL